MKLPKHKALQKPEMKVPKVAQDLYADLRDRHLLPLVALLIVAIVAVPFLLSGGGEEEPSPPVAGSAPSPLAQASFAVVPDAHGLREYRRRFGHRTAEDPFRAPGQSAKSEGSATSGKTSAAAGGDSESAPEGGSESAGQVPAEGGSSPTVNGGGAEAPSSSGSKEADVVVQRDVIGYAIDTHAGFLGHIHDHDGIEPVAKLPSPQNPVVVFTGLSKDRKRALFLMSNDVTAYYGKGRCGLGGATCQVLELKPGQSATFAYGYGNTRYKLSLKKIMPVVRRETVAASVTDGR